MDGRNDMKPTPAKLTYDDFVNFPDDGQRHELIDGEHYVTPSPQFAGVRLTVRSLLMRRSVTLASSAQRSCPVSRSGSIDCFSRMDIDETADQTLAQ